MLLGTRTLTNELVFLDKDFLPTRDINKAYDETEVFWQGLPTSILAQNSWMLYFRTTFGVQPFHNLEASASGNLHIPIPDLEAALVAENRRLFYGQSGFSGCRPHITVERCADGEIRITDITWD